MDLQQQIFDQIPELLQDIEVAENNRASALNAGTPTDPEIQLNAAFTQCGSLPCQQGSRPFRGRANFTTYSNRTQQPQKHFCRLCYLSYNSHDISSC